MVMLDESQDQTPNTITIQGDGDYPLISYDLRLVDMALRSERRLNDMLFPRPKTEDELLNNLFLEYYAGSLTKEDWNMFRSLVPRALQKFKKKTSKHR